MVIGIGSSNVPLRYERKGRGAMPSRAAGRDGASEAEAPLCLRMALRLCGVADDHQDVEMGFVVQEMLPEWSDRGASRLGAHRADRTVRARGHGGSSYYSRGLETRKMAGSSS